MVTKRKVNKQPLSDRDFTLINTNIIEIVRKNPGDSQKELQKVQKKDLAKTKAMLFVFRACILCF